MEKRQIIMKKQFLQVLTSEEVQTNAAAPEDIKEIIDAVNNRIYYYGDITQDKSVRLIKLLRQKDDEMQIAQIKLSLEECPPIFLHINSYGGEAHASFGIADNIVACKSPIYTIIEGVAASGATIISIVGKKRYIRKHSHVLIHQLADKHWGNWESLKDDYKNSEMMMNQIYAFYEKYSTLKKTKIRTILKHDLFFSAEQCKKYGLVDEII